MDELKDTLEPLPGPENWIDAEKEAARWELPAQRVTQLVTEVEEEKRLQIELKIRRREQELVNYLRAAYDREAQKVTCPRCDMTGFDTWGDFSAHMRMHLAVSADEKVAVSALNSVDKLVHPVEELALKVQTTTADRGELLDRISGALARRLKGQL